MVRYATPQFSNGETPSLHKMNQWGRNFEARSVHRPHHVWLPGGNGEETLLNKTGWHVPEDLPPAATLQFTLYTASSWAIIRFMGEFRSAVSAGTHEIGFKLDTSDYECGSVITDNPDHTRRRCCFNMLVEGLAVGGHTVQIRANASNAAVVTLHSYCFMVEGHF